jgi:phosphocarrier protein
VTKKHNAHAADPRVVVKDLTITNRFGIHARPAALFVRTASRFTCDIEVEKDGSTVSAKSIMGLLTLEGSQGTILRIRAKGDDAREAVAALQELVEKKFYED